jgi:peptidyl-prolyl cis-trans isomerase SurA
MRNQIKYLLLSILFTYSASVYGQSGNSIDKIIAIVGDRVILQSEIQQQFAELASQNPEVGNEAYCTILENLLSRDLLCEQAERDSIMISDEEVEGYIDNRIRYFVSMYGNEERMMQVTGKSAIMLKDEYRRLFRDQLLANRMQNQLMSGVKITPTEVRAFYDKIPQDSLPYYPSMVEVGQIVFTPTASKEVDDYAREQLEDTRKQIMEGKLDFATAAGIVSEDGSRDNGGDLGVVSRDEMVPEFTSAAFKLQTGEISGIVKSRFGYHIIQMVQRKGEKAHLRHILIKPKITSGDITKCQLYADSVRNLIVNKQMSFYDAVSKFTTDEGTKLTGGMFSNPNTGSSYMAIDELEPEVALEVGKLTAGEISKPFAYSDMRTNDRLVRIVLLKNISEPHKANLKDDYSKIQAIALAEKQNKYLMTWINEHISNFYIFINADYQTCENINTWMSTRNSEK